MGCMTIRNFSEVPITIDGVSYWPEKPPVLPRYALFMFLLPMPHDGEIRRVPIAVPRVERVTLAKLLPDVKPGDVVVVSDKVAFEMALCGVESDQIFVMREGCLWQFTRLSR